MLKKLCFIALTALFATSCSSHRSIGNGAYSDISLNRSSDQYELKRLPEVNSNSRAIFGIPVDKNVSKKEGIIVRFNGVNLNAQSRFLPALSMIAITAVTGSAIHEIVGNEFDEEALGYGVSYLGAIPIAGFLNNQIWSDAALSRASWNANSELMQENQEVDVFLNPKYEIETSNGIWTQRASLNVKAMGARILTDND